MKTILTFETTTRDDIRGQAADVAAMQTAIEAFELAMATLGRTGAIEIRHVRPKTPTAIPSAAPPPNGADASVARDAARGEG